MFTGIIEEVGCVNLIENGKIIIKAKKVLEKTLIGDSIAVNGVCLTVTSMKENEFSADVMNETLSRSSLGKLKVGSKVNLERAMSLERRFGGHIVSGHIDGIGKISKIQKDSNAIWIYISSSSEILNLIVEKGSIAIDGISLTVAKVNSVEFAVSIIPHTLQETSLSEKKIGDIVNLENDIIGKYVQKLMKISSKNDEKDEKIEKENKLLDWLKGN